MPKYLKLLEVTRIKIAQKATNIDFLKKCWDQNIIPQFTPVKHRLHTSKNDYMFKNLSLSLIRAELKKTRSEIHKLFENACRLHLKLANKLEPSLWDRVDSTMDMKRNRRREWATKAQNKKFINLHNEQERKVQNVHEKNSNVINLSTTELNEDSIRVLEYGLNFAITPRSVPTKDLICNIESVIAHLPDDNAEEVRRNAQWSSKKREPRNPIFLR